MKLYILVGNAFIELYEHDLPMVLSKTQLFNYATVVSNKLNDPVDLSGAGIMDLKLNYDRLIKYEEDGVITPANGVTIMDFESRCRYNLSTKELNAVTSLDAKKTIGILPTTRKTI